MTIIPFEPYLITFSFCLAGSIVETRVSLVLNARVASMEPFNPSTFFDEDVAEADMSALQEPVQHILNYLSAIFFKRVKAAARRAPKVELSIPLVVPTDGLLSFFDTKVEERLFVSVPHTDDLTKQYFSPYFQAGQLLSGFHRIEGQQQGENGENMAAGPLVVHPRGDMSLPLPPYFVSIQAKKNSDGACLYWSFKMTCQIAVVSASPIARIKLANAAPDFSNKRWAFMPSYARLEEHAERHVQHLCRVHGLKRSAASVKASQKWIIEKDPLPNATIGNRACDKKPTAGHVWCESQQAYVSFNGQTQKRAILSANETFRFRRIGQAKSARSAAARAIVQAAKDAKDVAKAQSLETKRLAESRIAKRRKKMKITKATTLDPDDDAASYSSSESLTPSEDAWLRNHNRYGWLG